MDKGTKNYRDMMRNMEKINPSSVVREGEINLERPGGMIGGTPDMLRREGENMNVMRNMGAEAPTDQSNVSQMMKELDPRSVVREGETEVTRLTDEIMKNLSMSDREAIEALTTMGISLEDAIEALFNPRSVVREGEMNTAGGVLQALPMQRPAMKPERDPFGADRTQSMDMQKEGMGT